MNSKERIKAAMELEAVDQVPFMCQMSIGHMLIQLGVSPIEFWFDKDVYTNGLLRLREQYGFDGILVSLYGHDPNWRDNISNNYKTKEFEIGELKNGDKIICPYNDLPYYEYVKPSEQFLSYELWNKNLPQKLDYFPVSRNLPYYINQEHKFDVLSELVSKIGNEFSIHGEITSPFDYFLDYVGYQNALMGILDNQEGSKIVLEYFTKLLINLANDMCNTGIDAIKISSPFAGSNFISPEQYMEFVFPYEQKLVKTIRQKDVHVYLHTCGTINDRLEFMFDTGASGIECLDPKPLGDVELAEAKNRIGSRGFIKGNLDSVNLLLNGSPKEIKQKVEETIRTGSANNGFILSTACSIAPDVSKENIQFIRKIINESKSELK